MIRLYAAATALTYWVVMTHGPARPDTGSEIWWIALDVYLVRRMLRGSTTATVISMALCVSSLGLVAATTFSNTHVDHPLPIAALTTTQIILLTPVLVSRTRSRPLGGQPALD